jgi:hypothetical protein
VQKFGRESQLTADATADALQQLGWGCLPRHFVGPAGSTIHPDNRHHWVFVVYLLILIVRIVGKSVKFIHANVESDGNGNEECGEYGEGQSQYESDIP